jgi:DnaJ-class molecular chaperone
MAVLGGEIKVSGVDKDVKIKIPAGTQSNEKFKIKGEGVRNNNHKGDLYAEVIIDIPKNISKEYKKIVEELKKLEE